MKQLSDHFVEIRFAPQGRILDKRGEIASALKSELFEHWRVQNTSIDFSSENNKRAKAYFTYKNIGFISQSPNSTEFFVIEAKKFVDKAWPQIPNAITRIGVRSTFFCETKHSFDTLLSKVNQKFLKPTLSELSPLGNLVDTGFNLNFERDGVSMNINFGPMEKEEAIRIFGSDSDEFPENGLFIDIDYFLEKEGDSRKHEVLEFIDTAIKESISRKDFLNNSFID